MKHQFLFFLFLSLIFSVSFVSATITPNQLQLNFDLVKGEEACKSIALSSNEPASAIIRDVWAEEYNQESSLSKFTYSAGDHGLSIDYENSLEFDKAESIDVNICITGSEAGKYQGALIFSPQGESGNVIQYSTWLKVIVEEPNIQQQNSGSGGGGGGGGSSGSSGTATYQAQTGSSDNEVENLVYKNTEVNENEAEGTNSWITGSVIGNSLGKGSLIGLGMLIILICVIAGIVYYRRNKE